MSKALDQVIKSLPDMTYQELEGLGGHFSSAVQDWLADRDHVNTDFDNAYFCTLLLDWIEQEKAE